METRRCERCGAKLSLYTHDGLCAPCKASLRRGPHNAAIPTLSEPSRAIPYWFWASSATRRALATRDLGQILSAYRSIHGITQHQLGELLGLDQSYVCRIENGRRIIRDAPTLRRITTRLGLPPRVVGLTTGKDDEFDAMCQFAESTLRLAEVARHAGRPMEAVRELWPLVARLESQSANAPADSDVLILLAGGCLALGTALGDVLPEEQLRNSARCTQRALQISDWLEDPALKHHALNLHGNELRKGGDFSGAVTHFTAALGGDSSRQLRGDTLMLMARALGEMGDARGFDQTICDAEAHLLHCDEMTHLFNPFSIREAHIRGLLSTGRADGAVHLLTGGRQSHRAHGPVRPQWQVMERITVAGVLAAGRDVDGATDLLSGAIQDAETYSLPHQIQRAVRVADSMSAQGRTVIRSMAHAALVRLRDASSLPLSITGIVGM